MDASTVEGRGVPKSTLTMFSVLGERMKARDPRRSPCQRTDRISQDAVPRTGPRLLSGGLPPPCPGPATPLLCSPKISAATTRALLELRGQP